MTPKTSSPTSIHRFLGRRPRRRLLAVAAVAVLAASGAFAALGAFSGSHALSVQDAAKEEASTKSNALAHLNALAGPVQDAQAAVREASAASAAALAKASKPMVTLSKAASGLAGTVQAGLPELPAGYLPGMDVGSFVQPTKVAPFPLPSFPGSLDVGSFQTSPLQGSPSPVAPRDGPHLPATGVPELDAVAGQLLAVHDTLEEAAGGGSDPFPDDLDAVVQPVTDLVGPLPPLGLSYPNEAGKANDYADPDEEGAKVASGHASALLSGTEGVYAVTHPSLSTLLQDYEELAVTVQDLIAEARAATVEAKAGIEAQLDDRLAAIQKGAAAAEKEAVQGVLAYRQAVAEAAGKAQDALQDTLAAQTASVQDALQQDLKSLEGLAAQAEALAASRQTEIAAAVDAAVADLSGLQYSSGLDTTASVEAVRAAGAAALDKVAKDALQQRQAAKDMAADLQARAEAALRQLSRSADAALADLNGTAAQVLGQADTVRAFLVDLARAQAAAASAQVQAAADAALDKLPTLEQARVSQLVEAGLELTEATDGILDTVGDLVFQVGTVTGNAVEADIAYIEKVSNDYRQVPAGERTERAQYWAGVALSSADRLTDILDTAQELDSLASKVVDAAEQARGLIEKMA